MSDIGETAKQDQWRGWKYYCNHKRPTGALESLRHTVTCGRMPITEIDTEDCVEGCNCIWDPSGPDYWRNHAECQTLSPSNP